MQVKAYNGKQFEEQSRCGSLKAQELVQPLGRYIPSNSDTQSSPLGCPSRAKHMININLILDLKNNKVSSITINGMLLSAMSNNILGCLLSIGCVLYSIAFNKKTNRNPCLFF
jgi:hypothetical protein